MNQIFIDTGFIIALVSQRDQYHQQALELADRYENFSFLTTDAVLLEVGNALVRNYKQQAIEVIEKFLDSDEVEIISLSSELFDRALTLYKQYQDKEWGLVDCVSFIVMREKGVNQALAFDQHFMQAGFQLLSV
ncbi:type II toxin-antitoxin system VapC family toxin [Chroococcidiopsis sp. SAG 2025]|uniref:type II toxin-antitoxin system VapC family toxin n=1 Tax=Chroococcidiopsis sp. SAG 2025 TaxID=171389 RepID=UPI0029372E72|nr:PIN domain-containing protein [Chroococcidiopsis sp. SAG 2025]